jgi:hypothetical protein
MDGGLQISWQAVGALSGALTTVGVLQALYLRLMIKSSNADLIKYLNGKYVAGKLCEKVHEEVDRRLEGLEEGHCSPHIEPKELS